LTSAVAICFATGKYCVKNDYDNNTLCYRQKLLLDNSQ